MSQGGGGRSSAPEPADPAGPPPDTELELERLRRENERLRRGAHGRRRRFWRALASWVLLVLACLLAVVSVVVVYTRNELLNTDTFVATVGPLAREPAVQQEVANRVSAQLVARTDLERRVKDALPAKAGFLAAPITSGVQTLAHTVTLQLVQSPAFQSLWDTAVRQAHKEVTGLLTGSGNGAVSTSNGEVAINLAQVENTVKQRLSDRGLTMFEKVPTTSATHFVLFRSTQLQKLQRLTKVVNRLAYLLPVLSLLFFAAGVVLTESRRRGLVRAATGLALSMAVVLVAANVGESQYLASLLPSQSKDAAAAVIDDVAAALLDSVRTILVAAAVVAVVALLFGNRWVRSWLADRTPPSWVTGGPVKAFVTAHRAALQWGLAVVGIVTLVLWSQPTIVVTLVVVLVALGLIGLVGLYARGPAVFDGDRSGPPALPDADHG